MLTTVLTYGNSFDYEFVEDSLSSTDWSRLLQAGRIAARSSHRFKLGCIIFKGGRALSLSVNKRKTHPSLYPNRNSLHAEITALKKLKNPSKTTVYVARLGRENQFCLALSCLYCVSNMLDMNVDRVVYTVNANSASSFHLNSVTSKYLI